VTSATLLFLVIGLGLVAWFFGRLKASGLQSRDKNSRSVLHSLPNYHGWYVALWAILPAAIFMTVWSFVSPALITDAALTSPAALQLPPDAFARAAILSEARAIAYGNQVTAFNPLSQSMVEPYRDAISYYQMIGAVSALLMVFSCGVFAWLQIKPDLRARTKIERVTMLLLLLASLIAIVTTVGIFLSLVFDTARFFSVVSPIDLL